MHVCPRSLFPLSLSVKSARFPNYTECLATVRAFLLVTGDRWKIPKRISRSDRLIFSRSRFSRDIFFLTIAIIPQLFLNLTIRYRHFAYSTVSLVDLRMNLLVSIGSSIKELTSFRRAGEEEKCDFRSTGDLSIKGTPAGQKSCRKRFCVSNSLVARVARGGIAHFAGSHVRSARFPREGRVGPRSARGLSARRGPGPDSGRASARAQPASGSPDFRASRLPVRGVRRDAEGVSRAAEQDAVRRGVLLLDHHVDPSESRRSRARGVSAKGLRAGGNDRRRAATVEVLPKRVEEIAEDGIGGVSAAAGIGVHRGPDRARGGHSDEAVQFSQSRRHRG